MAEKLRIKESHLPMYVALVLVIILLLCTAAGCQFTMEQSRRELLDLEKTRVTAKNYLTIAPMQIGFIKGSMGENITELPIGTLDAIEELHDLAADPNSNQDDFSLGYSLGLRVRITNDIIKQILERYAPEVLRFWP